MDQNIICLLKLFFECLCNLIVCVFSATTGHKHISKSDKHHRRQADCCHLQCRSRSPSLKPHHSTGGRHIHDQISVQYNIWTSLCIPRIPCYSLQASHSFLHFFFAHFALHIYKNHSTMIIKTDFTLPDKIREI